MSIEVKIPAVGESISEVQINAWLKSEGDDVTKDEPLAVLDSEKTTFELPATVDGKLSKILHQAGETVAVGSVIAELEPKSNGAPAAQQPATAPKLSEPKGKAKATEKTPVEAERLPSATETKPQPTSPAPPEPSRETQPQKKVARRSTERRRESADEPQRESEAKAPIEDEAARPSEPPPSRPPPVEGREEEVVPMSMLRRTITRRLVEAKQSMAMLTTFNEVDMDAVQQLRHRHQEAFQKRYAVKLGVMSFFVKAVIDALKQFPQLNAEVRGHDIVYRNYFDLGVAIATERGLVVPVLRRAERMSFAETEKAIADFATRAKDGQLQPQDLEGGTFTITNGGVFGSLFSTPIINPPQSGILGLHAIDDRPVARDGQVVIRPMMYLALTYDHRLVDGREAVLFLRRIRETIENPARMLIEI